MENSILTSIKNVIGLAAEYTAFDEDIIMHTNSVFSDLMQLGIGPSDGFVITDENDVWSDYATAGVPPNSLNSVKSYVFLRLRLLFDPPSSSFAITSMENQIERFEWRLNVAREEALYPTEEVV